MTSEAQVLVSIHASHLNIIYAHFHCPPSTKCFLLERGYLADKFIKGVQQSKQYGKHWIR